MRKYAIKKPSNLKTILTIDKWTRKRAMEISKKKTNENIFYHYLFTFVY